MRVETLLQHKIIKAANVSLRKLSPRARNQAVGTIDICFLFIPPKCKMDRL